MGVMILLAVLSFLAYRIGVPDKIGKMYIVVLVTVITLWAIGMVYIYLPYIRNVELGYLGLLGIEIGIGIFFLLNYFFKNISNEK